MIIIHGDNQITSRDHFLSAKQAAIKQGHNIVDLSGDSLQLDQLIQAIKSRSLFGSANSVFIENLFSSRPSGGKKDLIKYVEQNQSEDIVIWEPKDVSSQLKTIDSKQTTKFDLPKHIFAFLDSPTLTTFHKVLEVAPVEQIFASLCTRLHKVLLGQGRFTLKFSPDQLKLMNSQLLTIDHKPKTSSSPYDLTTALELWMVKLHNE